VIPFDPRKSFAHPAILSYGAAILTVGSALLLTLWLDVNLNAAPVSIFICAVMLSAWFGGYGPGMLAAVLCILAFDYYFVPPIHSFAMDVAEIPRMVVFALAAFFVGSLSASQKRTAEALRASEQRFRDYTESASDWSWETGRDHAFSRVSEKLTALGIDPRSRIGARRWEYATDVDEEPEKWRLHRATLDAHQPFRHFRYRSARSDGSVFHVSTSGKPLFDANGRFLGYRGVSSDVTAAVRAEQAERALHEARAELAHVTRVTTLGEVTASFAHEVNQPLAAIVNNANACVGLLTNGQELHEVRDALSDIVSDAERASAIIRRVRALATRSSSERTTLRLDDIVADVVALATTEATARRVTIRTEVAADLPVVSGDRVQLQQVLLNLVVNGMDAMGAVQEERRRHLLIRGRPEVQDGDLMATISVEDHGIGLNDTQMERLFEAFYTTKPHGMGLGLAISRSIIEMHGGRLWAESNQGAGATFSFSVPAAASTASNRE
jgi:PAS domain S-box-containing protein